MDAPYTQALAVSAWGTARGGVGNPVQRDEVLEKFRKVTARRLTPASQDVLIAQCDRLEAAEDVTALITALR